MVTKIITMVCCTAFLLVAPCYAQDTGNRHQYSPSEYLKNYALSVCLGSGYESASRYVNEDASIAASGYMELGRLGIDAYNAAYESAKQFLDREYVSKSGRELILMKCIDFYHSAELAAVIQKYQ